MTQVSRLSSSPPLIVVTGQQPGLLGGPLYTIYKTLAAIELARSLASRYPDCKFVPVFWVASEDDDYDEVRRAFWPGAQGELEEILLDRADPRLGWAPGRMIGTLPSKPLAGLLVQRIRESTIETGSRDEVLDFISSAYGESANWEDAFCKILFRLFRGTGLVVVSPLMRWVRRRGAAILRQEIQRAGDSTRKIIKRGEELRAAGMEQQLHRRPDAINLFWIDDQRRRHPVRLDGNKFRIMHSDTENSDAQSEMEREEMLSALEDSPDSFGYNVVTRPMVQDSILPVVAQVVGPGEAAYLAQVESVYEDFGVFAPVRYPRPQINLLTGMVSKTLAKFNLTAEQALAHDAGELGRVVLERDMQSGLVGEVNQMKERHLAELKKLGESAGKTTALVAAFDKLAQMMTKGYDTIRERALYARQSDEQHLQEAMTRIENHLHPSGQPQERILNPLVPFAVLCGLDWVLRVAERINYNSAAPIQTISLLDFMGESKAS